MFVLTIFLVSFFIDNVVNQDLISPCPRFFQYEPRNPDEPDKMYAVLILHSEAELNGVWLSAIFDKPAVQLGNAFGIVLTKDNKEFKIQAPSKKLLPNVPLRVRFYIKYDPSEPPPRLLEYRINAKTVCPEGQRTTAGGIASSEYYTSPEIKPTSRPIMVERPLQAPTSNGNLEVNVGDINVEDFFPGDFNLRNDSSIQRVTSNKKQENQLDINCGTVVLRPTPFITYGQETAPGEWPWHAAIYRNKGTQLTYMCGGTIISRSHILTAAHCATKSRRKTAIDPKVLLVYLGKYNLKTFGEETQDIDVENIYVHPQYNSSTFYNDIAILQLSRPIQITDYVRPICLWEDDTNVEYLINKEGTVIGWGFDEKRAISDKLMQAKMPIVSTIQCIYSNREFFSRFTFDKNFCAGFRNGTSVCNGDSGGSMVFPKKGTSGQNTVWQIRGLVSVGVALHAEGICDTSQYVIFTDVAKHLSWIRQIINSN